jgi:hypothetical protein
MCLRLTLLLLSFFPGIVSQAQPDLPPATPRQAQDAAKQTESKAQPPATAPATTQDDAHENWSALALDKSGLSGATFNAVLLGKYEEPTYTREIVRMEWRHGDPIEVYIALPHGVTNPPVILYLYDYTSDTTRFQNDGWCRRATRDGFAAVGFVSALSGQRFHSPRPMKEWFVSELQEALATSTHDVQMVLNYLALRKDVQASSVGMIAQGSGGAIAVLAASVDSRIVALDLLNPWGDWPDWLKQSAQIPEEERSPLLAPNFLSQIAGLDPLTYLPGLKLKALRVQQIMDDPVTPPAARDKIAAAVPSPANQVVRYQNAATHQSAWRNGGLSGWIREQLHSPAAPLAQGSGQSLR